MDKNILWTKTLARLKEDLSVREISYTNWLEPLHPLSYAQGVLLLKTDNPFGLEVLNTQYRKIVLHHAQQIDPNIEALGFTIEENAAPPRAEELQPDHAATNRVDSQKKHSKKDRKKKEWNKKGLPINTKLTFASFIEAEETDLAYHSAKAVAENPGARRFNPLFIYGECGVGKTHLLHAMANTIQQERPNLRIVFTSAKEFYHDFFSSLNEKTMDEFKKHYTTCDVLFMDDIHTLSGKESSQTEVFKIFNDLHTQNRQMVFAAPCPPEALSGIADRLLTRLQWGLSVHIDAPQLETRSAILRTLLENESVQISHEAIHYLAQKGPRSIGDLEGISVRVAAHYSLGNKPINSTTAAEILYNDGITPGKIRAIDIITAITDEFGISRQLLTSKSRSKEVAQARQIGMFLCKEHTDLSLKAIGTEFGGRDHSTVVHAVKTVGAKMEQDTPFAQRVDTIIRRARQA
ncbi:chromosomal replication initiator protein DnaA [Chitinivibrio alkaliphilus]|uniref:Chromosomal replication initiator protein DnaA n=1 Tax=Chitinivibrio alkaliphilus ACht1 TaxID=1313304 RepID=U7D9S5_9BACT|nr:chromosomal replication initiator protein DnaA [Chitinivibrio alkaliphilus]ERP31175.1 chromosomal replication initiator protein DnaA [Chitinivibrio alkaliphilus ACht1]